MAILVTDLKYYHANEVSTDSTNGGKISNSEASSGVPNSVWPNVLKAGRDNGEIVYRKLFLKAVTDSNDTLAGVDLWNEAPTDGDDWITLFPGTADDTQATVDESDSYCAATLSSEATAASSTVIIELEDAALSACFPAARVLRITDKSAPDSSSGNEERGTISGTPSLSGTTLTITLADALTNTYAIGSKVEGIMEVGDVVSEVGSVTVTSSAGTYDDSTYSVLSNNAGAVTETITFTATDATHFTVEGTKSGTLDTWATGDGDYSPEHPVSGEVMFTMYAAGLGGTFVLNDTMTFAVTGAYTAFWLKRTVPAGSGSLANNLNTTYTYGQS